MSPAALVETGAPANASDGQKVSPLFSFRFSGSGSVPQSNQENLESMNSFGDLNSGFSNSGGINPNSSFDSAPFPRFSSGLSRPRLSKMRKQVQSQNLKPSGNSDSQPGLGFNPFHSRSSFSKPPGSVIGVSVAGESGFVGRSGNETFVFGANEGGLGGKCNSGDEIGKRFVEEMRDLKVDGEAGSGKDCRKSFSCDENVVSRLPENMQNLNIKDSGEFTHNIRSDDASFSFGAKNESKFVFRSGENANSSSGKNVVDELPNELNSKLKIHGSKEASEGRSSFNIGNSRKVMNKDSCSSTSESSGHVLQERMKNLNIKDGVIDSGIDQKQSSVEVNEKDSFIFKNKTETQDYVGEKIISDEMARKLSATNTGFSSSETFSKDVQKENAIEQNVHDLDKLFPMNSRFAGVGSSKNLNPRNVHDVPSTGNTVEFNFLSKQDGNIGVSSMEIKTPNQKLSLFSGLNQKLEFSAKRDTVDSVKPRRKGAKLKQPSKVQLNFGLEFAFSESAFSHESAEASESYSPMDVSPYQETQHSDETSMVPDQSSNPEKNNLSTDSAAAYSNDGFDEELVAATEQMNINEGYGIRTAQASEFHADKGADCEDLAEESVSGAETESFKSAAEEMETSSDTFVTAAETEFTSSLKLDRQDSDDHSPSSSDAASSNFTFTASSSSGACGPLAASKRNNKKKNLVNHGHDSYNFVPNARVQFCPFAGVQSLFSQGKPCKRDPLTSLGKPVNDSKVHKGEELKNESNAAQEVCEKWRLRGNHAYTNGDLSKAEESYTQGINSVSKNEMSRSCLRALMLCYSNRAATRMSLGRMREAIADCMMASSIDPNFLRVQVRAGNCYLSLGEVEDASRYFKKCLQYGSDICVDRKIVVEASEGLQKAQKVSECMHEAGSLLQLRTPNDAEKALEVLEESLSISSYSEKLLEMKAEALLMLQKYEEVIKLCEQTVDLAEKNSPPIDTDRHLPYPDAHDFPKGTIFRIWRCCLVLKSYFRMGKLEDAIASLEKQERLLSVTQRDGNKTLESSVPFAATIRELLRLKAAGNEAFQSGRHAEAIEHYTAALSSNVESRPFMAVCFCNRAAASKALGQIIDAIADCSLAIALDPKYLKAISRRATLLEMIRDYGQAANDIQRLVDLLTRQMEEKASWAHDRSTALANDLRQAHVRLSELEEKSRRGIPLDMYLILGVEPSCSASDIRKAYRKAALRHHPDKAGQSLSRNDSGDDRLWKEIGEEVHGDADKLFKRIGEAYAMLSDPAKRSEYDLEEEMRNAQKKRDGSSTSGAYADAQNHYYPFERSSSRRNWRDVWRSHGNSAAPRWSETARSNRFP